MGQFMILFMIFFLSTSISNYFAETSQLHYFVYFLTLFTGIYLLSYNNRNKIRGSVMPMGLKQHYHDALIKFEEIKNITGGPERLNIFTANGTIEMFLPKKEAVKLIEAGFINWIINNKVINVLPGVPGESLTVSYSPSGTYALGFSRGLYIFIAIFIFLNGINLLLLLMIFIFFLGLYYFLQNYRKVTIRIHNSGVSIIGKKGETVISFTEIESAKKGLLYIKITTKDHQVFHLPHQCLYLFEFLTILIPKVKINQ